jgi:trimethylamine--corrinoid protein Co-methyltransferase
MVSLLPQLPEEDVAAPAEFIVDYGYAAPWIYDYPQQRFRKATIQDQVDMIRLGDALASVKAVNAPLICSDFDPRVETIESARLLLRHTRKPGWVGTSAAKEVKYLAELAALVPGCDRETMRRRPPIFVSAYCTTSPLKLDTRSCEVLDEALPFGFPVNFAPMPILDATAPMTSAGAAIVAAAEILGCITAASLIDPDVFYFSTSIVGEMDMRTTQVCYCTPGAASGVHEDLPADGCRGRGPPRRRVVRTTQPRRPCDAARIDGRWSPATRLRRPG